MKAGRFVVFEGPDGAGKSTAISEVAGRLRDAGNDVIQTREPGGSPAAEAMRNLLMQQEAQEAPVLSQLLLITAARIDHLERVIRPALKRGATVLCDRYVDSSYIYQCRLGGVPVSQLDQLNALLNIEQPMLRLFFDLPAEVAIERMSARLEENRFDRQEESHWRQLADAYHWRAQVGAETVRRVDAAQDLDDVVNQCWKFIHEQS